MNSTVFRWTSWEMDGLDYMEEQAPEAMDDIKKKIQYTTDDQNPMLLVVRLK